MQWQGINEFVAVAEQGNFTQGAKALKVSTAHISRQINALEHRLNVKLLHRTTRQVSLSQEGQVFYQHCRNVLDGLQNAEQAISQLQQQPQGHIKLSAPVTYGEQHIMPLVSDFISQYPKISVHTELSNQRIDLIDQGFDLAIRLGNLPDSSLVAKKLSTRRHYVCATKEYLAKHGTPHSLSELSQHNCLLGTRDYWLFSDNDKERSIRVNGNLRCNSGIALVNAALKGIGIIQLPDYYLQPYLDNQQLRPILSQYNQAEEGIWAVYPQNRYLAPKVRLLINFLADQLVI